MSYQANKLIPGPTGPTGVGPGPTGPTGPTGAGTVTQIDTAGLISGGPITTTGTVTSLMNPNRLVGRNTGGVAGEFEEITPSTRLEMVGTNLNWIPTTLVVRNVTGNIDEIEEYTVCTAATGVELTLPTTSGTGGQRHTIVNRDAGHTLKIIATGAEGFGNKDVVTEIFIMPGEAMTFISDNVNTWLYQQDRTAYDVYSPTVTGGLNITTIALETLQIWRVGNIISFMGVAVIDPTANNTQTDFTVTLPAYGGSTFTQASDVCGTGVGKECATRAAHAMSCYGVVATNTMKCAYYETLGSTDTIVFHGSYKYIS